MKISQLSFSLGIFFFVLGIVLGVVQLWCNPWSLWLFLKLEVSIVALVCILITVWFVIKEHKENAANRIGDRLD